MSDRNSLSADQEVLIHRVLNSRVTFSRRLLQLSNAIIEATRGQAMGLAHVLEFPKCGGSWVRNMIRTYRGAASPAGDKLIRSGDVLMDHWLFRPWIANPIVVVRDPRDVFVSFYYYETSYKGRDDRSPLFRHFTPNLHFPPQEDFAAYLEAKLLHSSHPWFSFGQFLDSWVGRPRTCLVRYEDCLADPVSELTRILRFLGEAIDQPRVDSTIEATSFEAITRARYGESRMPGFADNTKFHRKGVAGDWRTLFTERSCKLLERVEGHSLRRLGYTHDSGWIDEFLSS